jgi:hypothetical protein
VVRESDIDLLYAKCTVQSIVFIAVCFLLCDSPASEFYMPTFRNTLSVASSEAARYEQSLRQQSKNV